MNLLKTIQEPFRQALGGLVADPAPYVAMVRPTQEAKHGDYQANFAMSLAKSLGKKPRDIAQAVVDQIKAGDLFQPLEVAGPGFINIRLRDDWLATQVQRMAADDRLGVSRVEVKTFVIDFSSPNVAKPMHVGHLRSTIIGDSLARLLRFLGHTVVTDNHIGDWGTQFGMLIYGYRNFLDENALNDDPVGEMVRIYKKVQESIEPSEMSPEKRKENNVTEEQVRRGQEVAEAARQETARLHAGDPENNALWAKFMPWCLEEINSVYKRLDIRFDHTLGESFYNPQLDDVVKDLTARGIAQESEGAMVIFFGEDAPPAIVRKKDGAFTYTTSDLATIRYRVQQWRPQAILYVVDFRQALHFKNLFDAARRWGYTDVALEHISFGSVLGKDGKPIKTRKGEAIELHELLDEAVTEAAKVYDEVLRTEGDKGDEQIDDETRAAIHEAVGIGAVKYADLCQNRTSDYRFDWSKMLAMNGNTATYMQYAYARNRSIFRKGGIDDRTFRTTPPLPVLAHPSERALALELLRFEENLQDAADTYQPSAITTYLWNLSKTYSGFFQNCPVLKAENDELRNSRLLLCDLTARVLQRCLDLLGIRTAERM